MLTSVHSHCCCWRSASLSSDLDSHLALLPHCTLLRLDFLNLNVLKSLHCMATNTFYPNPVEAPTPSGSGPCPDLILLGFSLCSASSSSSTQGTIPRRSIPPASLFSQQGAVLSPVFPGHDMFPCGHLASCQECSLHPLHQLIQIFFFPERLC